MQCPACRTLLPAAAASCPACGRIVSEREAILELVLPDGRRIAILEALTLGRADDNAVQLPHPTVSRHHARVIPIDRGARVEDAGSAYGTLLDGRPITRPSVLRDGSEITLGDLVIRVERRRTAAEAGRTRVISGVPPLAPAAMTEGLHRPRLRGGLVLKRLDVREGPERHVLRDPDGGAFLRFDDDHAALLDLLDGTRELPELVLEAEQRLGGAGPGRLVTLLSELADRGLVAGASRPPAPASGRLAGILRPHELATRRAGALFKRAYRGGGHLLFTRPAALVMATLAGAGVVAFAITVVEGDRAPFVVGQSTRIGVAAFIAGRALVVVLHESAHGLALASVGRDVPRAGLKLLLVFPYAFVDTSAAWLEPRRRRMAVTAAGPASDLVLAGTFSLVALAGHGTGADIAFQLALGAYLGAIANLNPFVDRDGAQLLADYLRQPGLRRRSRAHLAAVLAGRATRDENSRLLLAHGVAGLVWSVLALGFVVALSLRYVGRLKQLHVAPSLVWALLSIIWLVVAAPILIALARPIIERRARPWQAGGRA